VESVVDNDDCSGLADDRKPAQPHQRVETHVSAGVGLGQGRRHAFSLSRGRACTNRCRMAGLALPAARRHIFDIWTLRTLLLSPWIGWSNATRAWRRSMALLSISLRARSPVFSEATGRGKPRPSR